MFTIGGEANRGALGPVGVCGVQTGVAALVLDGDGLDGELTDGQGGTQPHPPLVRWLYHGVAPLCEGRHLRGLPLCRSVSPYDLLHLLGQTVGAREGGPLAAHCCLVAVNGDLSWEWKKNDR